MKRTCRCLFTVTLGLTMAGLDGEAAALARWPQFRGPNGSGVADGQMPPLHFAPATNQLWKTPLPSGVSSPCVWDDRIFLTGFSDGSRVATLAALPA